jgi:hypothetical protein
MPYDNPDFHVARVFATTITVKFDTGYGASDAASLIQDGKLADVVGFNPHIRTATVTGREVHYIRRKSWRELRNERAAQIEADQPMVK